MPRFRELRFAALALALAAPAAAAELVDRVVAVIEGDVITYRELEAKAAPYLEQATERADPGLSAAERRRAIYRQVLDIEIGERIVAREIARNRERLAVSERDVDRAVEEVMKLNSLTREQLQAALFGQGLSWLEYRGKLREQIERARLVQFRTQGKVQVRDADARRRCLERQRAGASAPEVCASHVLLALPAAADAATVARQRARAERLRGELARGADFAAYALKYSDDKAAPDGRLGCFRRGEMLEAIDGAAFALEVGQISEVLRSDGGLHILKVTDRRAAATAGCEDAAELESFRGELYQEAVQSQMTSWVDELRKKSFVEVRL